MSWSTQFEALMPDTVTVATLLGLSSDGYGTETFSTSPTTFKARVVREQKLVRTLQGTEEMADTVVYIASTSTFAASSLITLPGGLTPPLLALEAFPDEDGIHHLRAAF